MSVNIVTISGNLAKDAEVRNTQSGMAIAQFSVAVNERVKQGDQWTDRANWIDCTMFGTRAEKLAQYLVKGSKVCVQGKLRQSKWQDNEGNNRSKIEVIVDEIEFMSARQDQAPQAPQYAPQQQYQPQQYAAPQFAPVQGYAPQQGNAPQPQYVEATIYDQDIPF